MSDTLFQQTTNAGTQSGDGSGQSNASAQTQSGFVGADGGFSDGWLDKLPSDLDPYKPTLAKYRDFNSLAKSHGELQQLLGKKSSAVNLPGEKSTPEEIAAFRKAFGVPEKSEEYSFKPEKLPDGVSWDDNSAKQFAAIAHKHHIPAAAMRELAAHQVAMEEARSQEVFRQMETELSNGRQTLQNAWGANFEKNLGTAARVAKSIGLDPESPGLRDPAVVQALFKVSQITSEDKLVSPENGATNIPGKMRANDIMTNKQNPLYERYQNGDSEIIQLVRDMLRNG
jgi:hypothetical protein